MKKILNNFKLYIYNDSNYIYVSKSMKKYHFRKIRCNSFERNDFFENWNVIRIRRKDT